MNLSTLFSAYIKARTRLEFTRHYNFDDAKLYWRYARLVGKLESRIFFALQAREAPSFKSKGKSKCQLIEHPEFGGCCCRCKFRLRAADHRRFPQGVLLGWACVAFAFLEGEDIAYIGDFEHGICELFTPRNAAVTEGDTSSCKSCGRPIEYFGLGWRHTTCCPVHLAIPAED